MLKQLLVIAVCSTGCKKMSVAVPKRIPTPEVTASSHIDVTAAGYDKDTRVVGSHYVHNERGYVMRDASGAPIQENDYKTRYTEKVSVRLDGKPLSIGALMVMGNPNFDADVATYAKRSKGCRRGRPLVLWGLGGLALGITTASIGGGIDNDIVLYTGVVAIGASVVSTVLGAQQGAFTCGRVQGGRWDIAADDNADEYVSDRAALVRKLAAEFNRTHGGGRAAQPARR